MLILYILQILFKYKTVNKQIVAKTEFKILKKRSKISVDRSVET